MPIRPPYLENGTTESQIAGIISGMEIPISSIKGAVTSVNGLNGDVKITPDMVDAQPKSALLSELSSMSTSTDSGMLGYSSGHFHMSPVSDFVRSLFLSPTDINFRGRLGLGSSSVLDVNVPHGIPQLDDSGKIPQNLLSLSLSAVAKTGSYNDLLDKPTMVGQVNADWNATEGSAVILNKPTIPTVNYPVTSVNQKTGDIVLAAGDVGAAPQEHTHPIANIDGLRAELDSKRSNSPVIYSEIQGVPVIPKDTADLTNTAGFITSAAIPAAPVSSVNGKVGNVVLSATDVGAAQTNHSHTIASVTGLQTALDGKVSKAESIPYSQITGAPSIPAPQIQSDWNQTNSASADFIKNKPVIPSVAYPVSSVNGKTGSVVLSAGDVGAATAASGTKYIRTAGTVASGVKVKYYTVTSDANGAWTLSLGTDFTEVLDVQAQAVSTTGLAGVRQSTVNAFSSNSTTITGMTWGNTLIVTILLSGTNSLSITPNTTVRVRVEGIGP